MKHTTELLLVAGLVIVVLMGALLSSFVRHLRWKERLFRWRMRTFFHGMAFVSIVVGAYLYLTYKK